MVEIRRVDVAGKNCRAWKNAVSLWSNTGDPALPVRLDFIRRSFELPFFIVRVTIHSFY
jgi:hypothetical protein